MITMQATILNALLLVAYVTVSSSGLYTLKIANGTIGLNFLIGLAFYGVGFLMWYGLLTRMPLSVAFPLAAGSLVIATQIVGSLFLNETLSLTHVGGIALITAGIAVIFVQA